MHNTNAEFARWQLGGTSLHTDETSSMVTKIDSSQHVLFVAFDVKVEIARFFPLALLLTYVRLFRLCKLNWCTNW